jgi:lysophospholipase L1-like esterase
MQRFLLASTLVAILGPAAIADETNLVPEPFASGDYFRLRSGLENSRLRFQRDRIGRVAFLGGSITQMDPGWRSMTCSELERRFPLAEFDFVNAGISSTDSTLGPHRLGRDVFAHGRVDLLFVEFAVNDHHNLRDEVARVRGMEGIIRQARQRNPAIDIVMLYFVEPDKIEQINRGEVPPEIVSHEKVAEHYGVPVIDLAREVTARINAEQITWKEFGGLHPGPSGHKLYAASIARLFDAAWSQPIAPEDQLTARDQFPEPLDTQNYERGRLIGLDQAVLVAGWEHVDCWHSDDRAGKRKGFHDVPMLIAEDPGAILKLHFRGSAVGLLVAAGPDVGVLEFSINGSPYRPVDQFTKWSAGLHIPWAYMLDAELPQGEHELVLRTTARKNEKSQGHAARIVAFMAN